MKRPPLPYLLLLPLLAVLVFGNCGGGVNGFLNRLNSNGRLQRLNEIREQRLRQRAAARQQLTGRARRRALRRIEENTSARIDSLLPLGYQREKFYKRRNKIERRMTERYERTPGR